MALPDSRVGRYLGLAAPAGIGRAFGAEKAVTRLHMAPFGTSGLVASEWLGEANCTRGQPGRPALPLIDELMIGRCGLMPLKCEGHRPPYIFLTALAERGESPKKNGCRKSGSRWLGSMGIVRPYSAISGAWIFFRSSAEIFITLRS